MTLLAPGCASIWPTVAMTPHRSDREDEFRGGAERVAAQLHRRRPRVPGAAVKFDARRVCPAMPLTTPTARSSASSTGPCSMWTSA